MKIQKTDLEKAAENNIITNQQVQDLWSFLDANPNSKNFTGLNVIYYFGGTLMLAAMSLFFTMAWSNGFAIMALSLTFALLFLKTANNLWHNKNQKTAAAMLVTTAIALTPMFVYGLQKQLGLWADLQFASGMGANYSNYHIYINSNWLMMELATLLAGYVALKYYKFTFITLPLAVTFWYMSMDIAPLLFSETLGWGQRKIVSCISGILIIIYALYKDKKFQDIDLAYWYYIAGVTAFWGGLSLMDSGSELGKFVYFMINIFMIILSVYLRRGVFLVFGALGILGYLGHLSYSLFKDSFLFPIALTLLGVLILIIGTKYHQNKSAINIYIEKLFPTFLLKWRPEER